MCVCDFYLLCDMMKLNVIDDIDSIYLLLLTVLDLIENEMGETKEIER